MRRSRRANVLDTAGFTRARGTIPGFVRAHRPRGWRWATATAALAVIAGVWTVAAPAAAAPSSASSKPTPPSSPAQKAVSGAAAKALGSLPAAFVANVGQAPAGVAFVAAGAPVSLGPNDLVVSVTSADASAPSHHGRNLRDGSAAAPTPTAQPALLGPKAAASPSASGPAPPPVALAMHLVGANASAPSFVADPKPGTVNYLLGNDPSKWRTNLSTFATVGWHDVYPGIDVSYGGGKGQVEYTFAVAAGADPAAIRLSFGPNVSKVALDADGSLSLTTPAGVVRQAAPQLSQGSGASTTAVGGAFRLLPAGQVGFSVGAYDHTLPLVIDPTIAYSTYLGDAVNGGDNGTAIAVDPTGAAYVTGTTPSAQFPTTAGSFQPSPGSTGFVTKLNPSGTGFVYSTYFGGTKGFDQPTGIAVDAAGHAYLTGETCASDFPTTSGAYKQSEPNICSAGGEVWASELNAAGSGLMFSTLLAPENDIGPHLGWPAIAVDGVGNVYLTGGHVSAGFPTTPGAFQTAEASGVAGAFVTKLDPTGSHLVYSTLLAPSAAGPDLPFRFAAGASIAVDGSGAAYVSGVTRSDGFPTTAGVVQPSAPCGSCWSQFVAKLNPAGTALDYSTFLGTAVGVAHAGGLALDSANNVWVVGSAGGSGYPTTAGALQTSPQGGGDVIVSKLNQTGTALLYSTYMGGATGVDGANGVAVDRFDNAYVGGYTESTDFPTLNAFQSQNGFEQVAAFPTFGDGFVAKFAPAGTLLYSTYLGGIGTDNVEALAVGGSGDVYVTGATASQDFPITLGAPESTMGNQAVLSNRLGFVTKLAAFGVSLAGPQWGGVGQPQTYTATVRNDRTDADATGVTLTDTFPAGLSPGAGVPSQGTCSTSGATLTCDLGTITRNHGATVTVAATPASAGTVSDVATLSSSLGSASSGATTVVGPAGCASTITSSVTLNADIGPCPGPGVTVGADNVTLDLGGHKIFGTGNHTGDPYSLTALAGIHLQTRHGGTVENGEVSGFDAGVWLEHTTGVTMTGLNVHDNVGFDDYYQNAVLGDGIALFHSGSNVISNSTIVRNGIYGGIAVAGLDSDHNLITHNVIDDNLQISAGSDGEGIALNPFLEITDPRRGQSLVGNDIIDNEIKGNQAAGISSRSNTDSTYAGNDIEDNGNGFTFPLNGIGLSINQIATPITNITIENNIIAGNGHNGIEVGSEDNHILNNVVVNNNVAGGNFPNPGVDVQDLFTDPNTGAAGCDSNVWSGNIWSAVGFFPDCTSAGGHPDFLSAPVGVPLSFAMTTSGFPAPTVTLTSGSLPAGVSYSAATGMLTGTPAAGSEGTYPLTFTNGGLTTGPGTAPMTQPFTLTVTQAATSTTVTASPASPTFGAPVTFTATVAATPANTLTPTGTVDFTFYGQSTPQATVPLKNGQAVFTTAGLGAGAQTVAATYSGDASFTSSTGTASITVNVTKTITSSFTGTLTVGAGTTVALMGATVNGPIVVQHGGAIDIESSTVTGSITATGATAVRMCGTTVSGAVTVNNATGFVLVGDAGDDSCAANTINNSATLNNNTGGLEVIGNTITGGLIAKNDKGAGAFPEDTKPEISGNVA